jgi:phage/plasmid-like protein (TIGR03299 family)
MSHEITIRANKKAEMAYVGETPWHGLGSALTAGADIETWKVAAGMDWKVNRSRVRYGEGAEQRIFDEQHVLFRSDTKVPLGVVGKNYKIVQPGECLEFFRDLVSGAGFTLETAGTLFGGKRYWALARISEDAVVVGQDRVGGFLLLSSSCDGSLATSGRFTTVRVVCNNTLTMAHSAKANAKVSHRSNFSAGEMKDTLGVARDEFASFMSGARSLAKVKMNDLAFSEFLKKLMIEQKVTSKVDQVTTLPAFEKMMNLWKGNAMGGTLAGASGTAWGALNAVTEYVDHHAKADHQANRLFNAWWGRGETLKNAALTSALAMV